MNDATPDRQANRDRALRRLTISTVTVFGGGCALTGFFALKAADGFSGAVASPQPTTTASVAAPATTLTTIATRPSITSPLGTPPSRLEGEGDHRCGHG